MTAQTAAPQPNRDWGNTAEDYAKFRPGFPPSFYDRLAGMGLIRPGMRVLDVGTGTGTLARSFARRGCEVSAIDIAPAMLAESQHLDREAGVKIEYRNCSAERISFADASFDLVTAGTCWHWFKRAEAAREAKRVLRPRGRLIIASLDMVTLPGNVLEATSALLGRFYGLSSAELERQRCRGNFQWPRWLDDLVAAGLGNLEAFGFEEDTAYSHLAFRGRMRASWAVGPIMSPERVAEFDRELASILESRFPTEPLIFPHRVFAVIATVRD